ncbi:hypothetical protein [Haloarchaeobius sp. DFWS5]|uniref:hypothetical protein n=1 Tax=Haloarchaeobius sp. DFWS5 TaxID=3446114 RepID=UPI003EB95249
MNPLADARGTLVLHGTVLLVVFAVVFRQGGPNTWLTLAVLVSGASAFAAALTVVRGPLPAEFARPLALYGDPGQPVGVPAAGPSHVGVFYSLFTLPASVAHELAHALAVVATGGRVETLAVTPGGDAYIRYEPNPQATARDHALVKAAPVLLLAIVAPACWLALSSSGLATVCWCYVAVTFLFSALPDQVYDLFG